MNEHPNNQTRPDEANSLPAELLGINNALNQLGASDRAAADAAFEQRLAASTLPGLPEIDFLAHADRDSASPTLEDRIFVATRSLLNRPAETVAAEADAPAPIRIHTRSFRWALRVAAVIALGAGATLIYNSNQPSPAPRPPRPIVAHVPSSTDIAQQLEADFEDLGNFLTVALGNSDNDSSDNSNDSNELEFPHFDLLNSEVEGSI